MRRFMKVLSLVLLTAVLLTAVAMPALAAESSITYLGKKKGFDFQPGSEYTDTDLFDNFKGVLPGDTLVEKITFRNKATDCDYVKLYLRAELHDEEDNPLSAAVAEAGETIVTMEDFLSQLTMRVYHGSKLIYEASPDDLDGLATNVYLGSFRKGKTTELKVELDVPVEMGNDYANRVGEVDWTFKAEGYKDSKLIQTGQLDWPVPVLGGLGIAMVLFGLYLIFGKRKNEYA